MTSEDEKNILEILVKLSEQTNKRIEKFTKYLLCLLILIVMTFSITICWIETQNSKTIQECTRLYFSTDYDYGTVSQTQTIGDIK